MSEKKWVRSSLRQLSQRLSVLGHSVSPPTVGRLLRQLGYSLRVNVKKLEAKQLLILAESGGSNGCLPAGGNSNCRSS